MRFIIHMALAGISSLIARGSSHPLGIPVSVVPAHGVANPLRRSDVRVKGVSGIRPLSARMAVGKINIPRGPAPKMADSEAARGQKKPGRRNGSRK